MNTTLSRRKWEDSSNFFINVEEPSLFQSTLHLGKKNLVWRITYLTTIVAETQTKQTNQLMNEISYAPMK